MACLNPLSERGSATRSVPTTCSSAVTRAHSLLSKWFEREFDDDVGKPDHSLCWSLALHRTGNEVGAAKKLRQAMLSNLYLLPHLLGSPIAELDIWHGSSDAEPDYIECIYPLYLALWSDEEKAWAAGLYESSGFRAARERYIEISRFLDT